MFRQLLCTCLCALLVWTNFSFAAIAPTPVAESSLHADLHENIQEMTKRMNQLEALVDKSQYDLESLLDATDYEPEQAVQFVKQHIAFQAYVGVLRGAQGALISRSGNALDQSLLLASLIKDAGYDARIVRGNLPPEHVKALLHQMGTPTPELSAFKPGIQPIQVFTATTSGANITPEKAADYVVQLVKEALPIDQSSSAKVAKVLEQAEPALAAINAGLRSAELEARLASEQSDYFWVEYRESAASGWQEAHPAFGALPVPNVKAGEYFVDEIPSTLQHRVRVQAFVETRLGAKTNTHPLMSAWERPAANAINEVLTLTLSPASDFEKDGKIDVAKTLDDAQFYALFLNGSLAPGAQIFSIDGLVAPPDALSEQGAFFATLAEKGLSAIDGLSSSNVKDSEKLPASELKRLWFEYSIIAPGGATRSVVRDVLQTNTDGTKFVNGQRANPEEAKERLKLALFQNREIAISTGSVNPAYTLAKGLENARLARDHLKTVHELQAEDQLSNTAESIANLKPAPNYRSLEFFAMVNAPIQNADGSVSYLAQPMLATFNRGLSRKQSELYSYEQTDIVFNSRRSLTANGSSLRRSVQLAAEYGVWDTYFETINTGAGAIDTNTYSAFSQLTSQEATLRYIAPPQLNELSRVDLDSGAELLARQELENGYGLLIPNSDSKGSALWWRVDPATGTLTGMTRGPGGYGGSVVAEYIVKGISMAISAVILGYNLTKCFVEEEGVALACCLIDSIVTGAIVFLLTYAITAMVVALFSTTGTIIYPGLTAEASAAASIAEKALSRTIGALVALMATGPARIAMPINKFRINICSSQL